MPDQRSAIQATPAWPGGARPTAETATAAAVRAALDAASAMARTGSLQQARAACAAILFEAQPTIAARPDLLRATLHALLLARGCKLLARLVLMASGRCVQVAVADHGMAASVPSDPAVPAGQTYVVDSAWIAVVMPQDAAFQAWCDALLGQGPQPEQAGLEAERHLELA